MHVLVILRRAKRVRGPAVPEMISGKGLLSKDRRACNFSRSSILLVRHDM